MKRLTPEAFLELVDRYFPTLVLYARLRAPEQAEDLAQNAFLKLLEATEFREPPTNIPGWLFTVVRNESITFQRRAARRRKWENSVDYSDYSESNEPPPDARLLDTEIAGALQSLEEGDREIVQLRVWGGLSFSEIAEIVGIPKTSLFRRYESALGQLRERLG